ncbi:hypothetical protein [Sporosarcina cyprini]|uniref:hypothetical protein n=1 Tax=Sporosarcina cyprini TaxID=2910523 RepID=UPI001EE02859|nr:hypothetical protein [Sporosarcina cyprini]MCG3086871.1 hypothetical protein [Sporosarcina cyprini]
MNKFLPSELKDLSESKERVMRNVSNSLAQETSKRKWPYLLMTGIIVACSMLFVFRVVLDDPQAEMGKETPVDIGDVPKEKESPSDIADLSKPAFTVELGKFYLNGVTMGDSLEDVVERLGKDYTLIDDLDGTGADMGLDYEGKLIVFLYKDQVETLLFTDVDSQYGEQLYRDYGGIKFVSENLMRYMYSMENSYLIKMELDGDGKLLVRLMQNVDPNFASHPGFKYQPEVPGHTARILLDPTQPILSDANEKFYLHGLTLGDPQAKVTQYFGDDYTTQYEVEDADYAFVYGDEMEFRFVLGKLQSIRFLKVDESYFNSVLAGYEGVDLYSEETSQMVSTEHSEDGDLIVSLHYAK